MARISTPVWTWLEGATQPVRAGVFELDEQTRQGSFSYDDAYAALPDSLALDPWLLPLPRQHSSLRTPKVFRNSLNEGIFGAFLDACPEGFGADILNHRHGEHGAGLTKLHLLEFSPGDGVGALEVCNNIDGKISVATHPVEALLDQLAALEHERPSVAVTRLVADGTSMGGERPKMTVVHKKAMWLAKLQDVRDQPYMPAREDLAMTLAGECGIRAAQTELVRTRNARELLLVRRFDRQGVDGERHAYLSAHTLLRLDSHSVPGDRARSYLSLAERLAFLQVPKEHIAELWKRMAFNALVNNYDDHPRNHGVVRKDGQWQLAPAFDITPLFQRPRTPPILAMSVQKEGNCEASVDALLRSAPLFGVTLETAATWLAQSASHVTERWLPNALSRGISESFCIEKQATSFAYAAELASETQRIFDAAVAISRERGRRRKN